MLYKLALTACAAFPAVCAITSAIRLLSVVHMLNNPVDLFAGCTIAAVTSVRPPQRSSQCYLDVIKLRSYEVQTQVSSKRLRLRVC